MTPINDSPKKQKMIRRIFSYAVRERGVFIAGLIVCLLLSLVSVLLPLIGQFAIALTGGKPIGIFDHIPFIRDLINAGFSKSMAEDMIISKRISRQFIALLILGGVYIVSKTLLDLFRSYLMTLLANRTVMAIRGAMVKSLTHSPLSYFKRVKEGELISRIQNDTMMIENFLYGTLPSIINDPLVFLLTLGILFTLSWKLTLVGLILVPVIAYFIWLIGSYLGRMIHKLQENMAQYTAMMQQIIFGIEAIKIFSKEEAEHRNFVKATDVYVATNKKVILLNAASRPTAEFLLMFSAVGMIAYGGYLVFIKEIPFEFLWGFILFLLNVGQPVRGLSDIYVNVKKAQAAAERVFEIVDLPSEHLNDESLADLKEPKGKIVFNKVRFSYNPGDEFKLGPVSFTVRPGEVAAFVGPSGGGKTTIVNLIPKLITPTAGQILYDGSDIAGLRTKGIRETIGMVAQENILFYGSIEENIRYGRADVPRAKVIEAARIAHAHEFIIALPKGYDTVLGERGLTLSGGQRQRVALARAVIREPKILILDEATSALDTESEHYIQQALASIVHRQTTFIIAHRLSTVKNADCIYVIEQGKIVESGTHAQLMKKSGRYKNLYSLQFV
ncbi:MAG: ABC transporter ATP-binding protein [Spirochaetes bacterium]|nr:ABC transporter ATP-binding protein [Spirochaetota bacterium]